MLSDNVASGILKNIGVTSRKERDKKKQSRKEEKQSAPGRTITWSETHEDKDRKSSEITVKTVKKDKRLACLESYLAMLPDKVFGPMVEESASLILSSAVHLKHGREKLLHQEANPYRIPRSAEHNFKLLGSKAVQSLESFKSIEIKVEERLRETELFIKEQIMAVQKMEILDRKKTLQKVVFDELFKLTRIFVVFFRTRNQSRCSFDGGNDQITSYVLIKTLEKTCEK